MFRDEYSRLAKSVDNLTRTQAEQIIKTVLEKIKADTGAIIVDVWVRQAGQNVDILRAYVRRSDQGIPGTQDIAMTDAATGLLVWMAENRRPIWLDNIREGDKEGTNLFNGEVIGGRYFNLYDKTRSFAAVPIEYSGGFGILTVELGKEKVLQKFHLDLFKSFSQPTGLLIWKVNVFEERQKQTDEAVFEFSRSSAELHSGLNPYRTGFIARPFESSFNTISHSVKEVFRKHSVCAIEYKHPPGDVELVASSILRQIGRAHFCIADITSLNQNVLVELGAMLAVKKHLIILRNKADKEDAPFNIAGYQIYRYEIRGGEVVITDAVSPYSLGEFIDEFIRKTLMNSPEFVNAAEYQ